MTLQLWTVIAIDNDGHDHTFIGVDGETYINAHFEGEPDQEQLEALRREITGEYVPPSGSLPMTFARGFLKHLPSSPGFQSVRFLDPDEAQVEA